MTLYARSQGVLVEPVGQIWAAFSGASGETILLNDEGAAILEVLALGPRTGDEVASELAADTGDDAPALRGAVESAWPRLVESGLVDVLHGESSASR